MMIDQIDRLFDCNPNNLLSSYNIDEKSLMIKEIIFENFKIFENETIFHFKNNLNVVVGDHGTGKTTIIDGIYCCLTGKCFSYVKDNNYLIKLIIEDGNGNLVEICRNFGSVTVKINNLIVDDEQNIGRILSELLNNIIILDSEIVFDACEKIFTLVKKIPNIISKINDYGIVEINPDGSIIYNGNVFNKNFLPQGLRYILGVSLLFASGTTTDKIMLYDEVGFLDEELSIIYRNIINDHNGQTILLKTPYECQYKKSKNINIIYL